MNVKENKIFFQNNICSQTINMSSTKVLNSVLNNNSIRHKNVCLRHTHDLNFNFKANKIKIQDNIFMLE